MFGDDDYIIGFSLLAIVGFVLIVLGIAWDLALFVVIGAVCKLAAFLKFIKQIWEIMEGIFSWLR